MSLSLEATEHQRLAQVGGMVIGVVDGAAVIMEKSQEVDCSCHHEVISKVGQIIYCPTTGVLVVIR